MAYKMRRRAMGLQVEVADSNSRSPALKRPMGVVPGASAMHKDSPMKSIWLIRYSFLKISFCSSHAIVERLFSAKHLINRHGESEHNTTSDWGIRDPGLTEQGWKQVSLLEYTHSHSIDRHCLYQHALSCSLWCESELTICMH